MAESGRWRWEREHGKGTFPYLERNPDPDPSIPGPTLSSAALRRDTFLRERQKERSSGPTATMTSAPMTSSMAMGVLRALKLESLPKIDVRPPLAPTVPSKFTRMSYVFDVSSEAASRLPPQVVTHGLPTDRTTTNEVPPEEFPLIKSLLDQKHPHPSINESSVDIFEDAGTDYHFRPRTDREGSNEGAGLQINPIEFASLRERENQAAAVIPESVESVLQNASASVREGHPARTMDREQDAASYLIMGYDYNDEDDGDGEFSSSTPTGGATRLSKRQKLRRDAQKLDRQVRQVARLMEDSSKHDK